MTETKRLGRGLEALLGPVSREQAEASGTLRELPIAQVRPNPYQPRTRLDEPAQKHAPVADPTSIPPTHGFIGRADRKSVV